VEPLEAMLVDTNRRLKRSKAFDPGRVQGRLVAALDGIEVLSSFSRRLDCNRLKPAPNRMIMSTRRPGR
jgi:predicted N-formylglutamate amidohydrolase